MPCYRRSFSHRRNLIPVPEILSDTPNLQEILWNFSRFKDKKKRLTLKENSHFYAELPTSPEAYRDSLKIDPTEDFRHTDKFYVLTDTPEPIHIMSDLVLHSFGNFWFPKDAIIFKGSDILFFLSLFLTSFQTSVGGSEGRASSTHLSEAHTVESVNGFWYPPFQEFPGIAVDCSQLSQRDVHG